MKVSDLAMVPLRWRMVRSPAMFKERARSGFAFDPFSAELHARSGFAFDPFSAELHEDPYPLLAGIREHDPVHWLETYRGWLITRHDNVDALLRISPPIGASWRAVSTPSGAARARFRRRGAALRPAVADDVPGLTRQHGAAR